MSGLLLLLLTVPMIATNSNFQSRVAFSFKHSYLTSTSSTRTKCMHSLDARGEKKKREREEAGRPHMKHFDFEKR